MATAFSPSGHHSPTALTRTVEKVFDEAQHTGHINLIGRKLKDYPKLASKYDLSDTSHADLSKNRYMEIPPEVCEYTSMEDLSCYHNVIRCIPQAIVQLQSLVHLNLSRNQLSNVPPFICQLQSLEVLRASNNKLVSLPEEIGRLERLMDLDVSCNEITHLPMQIGDLESLKTLNVRKNLLVELPEEISKLSLQTLDCSSNKISTIPTSFRKIETLEELILDHNPLVSPPAHICTKGKVHIMKYLIMEAIKEDRKRGVLISESDHHHMRRHFRKSSSLQLSNSDELKQTAAMGGDSPVDRRKRNGYLGGDSGYNTTDSTEKSRWSPPEVNNEVDELNNLAVKAAENVKEQRQERELELQRRIIATASHDPVTANGGSPSGGGGHNNNEAESYLDVTPPGHSPITMQDEFTRELNRQKSEYEAKKRRAEQLRIEKEEEEERRRRATKIQEEQQKVMMERQREDSNKRNTIDNKRNTSDNNNYNNTSSTTTNQLDNEYLAYNNVTPSPVTVRKPIIHTSQSFKEEKKVYQNNNTYRRTVSETNHFYSNAPTSTAPTRETEPYYRNNGVNGSAESSPSVNRRNQPQQQPSQHVTNQETEFRLRHEAMIQQQRQEAQNVMRRIEEEKKRMKQMQKDAVQCFNNKQQSLQDGPRNNMVSGREQADMYHQYNGDHSSNQPYNKHPTPKPKTSHAFSIGAQKRLEELASHNPNFTIRRQLEHAREELEKIEQLRMNIESRLKVTLPDDLPAALRDGVVLCHLANHVRPRSVSSIHVPSPAVPKLSMAKCRRNVENFLEACRRIGVDADKLSLSSDILEEKGLVRTATMVHSLLSKASQPRQSAV